MKAKEHELHGWALGKIC